MKTTRSRFSALSLLLRAAPHLCLAAAASAWLTLLNETAARGSVRPRQRMVGGARGHRRKARCLFRLRFVGTCAGLLLLLPKTMAGGVFTTLHSFDGTNGAVPEATLVQGADGALYGTTIGGGTNGVEYGGDGTVFRISTNGAFRTLTFLDRAFAASPQAGLVPRGDGSFLGTTHHGGPIDFGAVFKISPEGAFAVVTNFYWPVAEYPNGLVATGDGSFYGTAAYGGTNEGPVGACGSVFKVAADGTLTILASFNGTNGANPQAKLLRGDDGAYYGTTVNGGTNGGWGTVFKMTPDGTLTSLFSFNGTNGAAPMAPPTQAADGSLYGTTSAGGIYFDGTPYTGYGTIYKVAPDGTCTTLVLFDNTNGALPAFGGLLRARDGSFYGTTARGGEFQRGTVFRLTTNGLLTTVVSFSPADGREPSAGLVQTGDGSFYGVTMSGGEDEVGTIFRLQLLPDAPLLQCAVAPGGGLQLTWNAIPGNQYQLQSSPEVSPADWQDSGRPIIATNTSITTSASTGPGLERYYRVVVLSPP